MPRHVRSSPTASGPRCCRSRLSRGRYNQIANYALAQSEINIAIGAKPPAVYFGELMEQASGGPKKYGGITSGQELSANLREHCIPKAIFDGLAEDYDGFLAERRVRMAEKIRTYFTTL